MSFHPLRAVVSCAIALTVGACGVPTGPDSFKPIEGADVPNRLNDTTTTTTTTTTTVPPVTTLPAEPESTTTTSTEPEPLMETVDVFFVSRGQLTSKPVRVRSPVSANELIGLLEADPGSDVLDSEVPLNLISTTSEENGVLTIELNDRVFQRIRSSDQREAIAQMVLTFLNNLRGVGQAVFTIDGERQVVPIDQGRFSSEPVSLDDYQNMLVSADPADEPTTTTTTTETTTETTTTTTPDSIPDP